MAIVKWVFDGYTFPTNSQPEGRGGAGEWDYEEKVATHSPINSAIDVITSFGFKSPRRTIKGRCNQDFRDTIRGKQLARVEGDLVDAEGTSKKSRIQSASFIEIFPDTRYSYTITFIARE